MKGIENITRRIDQDAQAEIDAVLDKARSDAAEVTARYQAQGRRPAPGTDGEK